MVQEARSNIIILVLTALQFALKRQLKAFFFGANLRLVLPDSGHARDLTAGESQLFSTGCRPPATSGTGKCQLPAISFRLKAKKTYFQSCKKVALPVEAVNGLPRKPRFIAVIWH